MSSCRFVGGPKGVIRVVLGWSNWSVINGSIVERHVTVLRYVEELLVLLFRNLLLVFLLLLLLLHLFHFVFLAIADVEDLRMRMMERSGGNIKILSGRGEAS